MQNFTLDELSSYQTTNNMVLIKPSLGEQKITLPDGTEIHIDIQFEKEVHAPVSGTVVAVPHKLNVGTQDKPGIQWDVDMELMPGDYVVYSYLSAVGAMDHLSGQAIVCNKELYLLIPYDEVFVARREIILPLNGYCLIEPLEEQKSEWAVKQEKSISKGRVSHIGSLIRKYADGDGIPDRDNVRVGDIVSFDIGADLPVEYPLHASLEGKQVYYRIQRRYINGIIKTL